ncbi:MAG: Uma2 family endonuclease [Hyphomicrobium sp.]|nr:Uma2 family endonuclease [Hyphomicrobium sp.]
MRFQVWYCRSMNAPLKHPVIALAAVEQADGPLLFDADLYERLGSAGAFQDSGRVELLDGVIIRMNSQALPHMRVKTEVGYRLRAAIEVMGGPLEVGIEGSLRLDDYGVPEPDVMVFATGLLSGFVPAADVRLVVEVSDETLAKELGRKALRYAQGGIAEYWVCDIRGHVVHRMSNPTEEGYAERVVVRCGERLRSATIDGLAIMVPEF